MKPPPSRCANPDCLIMPEFCNAGPFFGVGRSEVKLRGSSNHFGDTSPVDPRGFFSRFDRGKEGLEGMLVAQRDRQMFLSVCRTHSDLAE